LIPPAAPEDPFAPRQWWETRSFVAAMILLAFVPLIYPPIPPLVDLLGHMGRYRVELDLAHSPDLQRYYEFRWALIGNLGVDLLIIPLSKIFGLELGVKLIVMSIPPLTVAGFLWVAREVHHRIPPTTLFALPFAYGHPFLYGFVNYALAMGLAFVAFGLWLRLGRLGQTRLRAALFVPISIVVFICHTFGWGALGLLCFSAEAVRQHDHGTSWWRAGIAALKHVAPMAVPFALILMWREGLHNDSGMDWFNFPTKAGWMYAILRDRWQAFDVAAAGVTIFVLLFALAHRQLGFSRNLAFSAMVLLTGYLLLPRILFCSAYADMRLAPFIIAVALIAIRFRGETPLPTARMLALGGLLFVLVRTTMTTVSLGMAAEHQSAQLEALDHVPTGVRVVSLAGQSCHDQWPLRRNSHVGAMAIVRRNAFENDQWAISGANLLVVKAPRAYGAFAADPSQIVVPRGCHGTEWRSLDMALAALPRQSFDYLWLIDPPAYDRRLVTGMRLVWRREGGVLYRIHP